MSCRLRRDGGGRPAVPGAAADRGAVRRGAGRRAARAAALAALLLSAGPARAEDRFLVRGLLDAEIWKTDDGSRLLSRDDGEAAPVGRLRLWAAGDFAGGLQGFVLGEVEGGDGTGEEETETEIEQAYLRYTFRSRPLRLEAGVLATPIGNFSRRYFSSVNPLIGSPDGYSVAYPAGVQLTGRAAWFDYRVAMVDGPLVNEGYVPEPGAALRPMLALGVNPVTGTRLGVYGTRGPYLGDGVEAMLPAGRGWKEYGQSVTGLDASFSRGHFELQADLARSRYEVPGFARDLRGTAWFVEPKYTFTPRLFAALRYERNDYPYIQPLAPGVWIGSSAAFEDLEIGAGCRLSPGAVLKISYRVDRWDVGGAMASQFPDGWSVAAQLSYTFDVLSWFERPR